MLTQIDNKIDSSNFLISYYKSLLKYKYHFISLIIISPFLIFAGVLSYALSIIINFENKYLITYMILSIIFLVYDAYIINYWMTSKDFTYITRELILIFGRVLLGIFTMMISALLFYKPRSNPTYIADYGNVFYSLYVVTIYNLVTLVMAMTCGRAFTLS